MKYLLTGVEFDNKGAEAMTLIALSNVCKRDLNAEIYFIYSEYKPQFELSSKVKYIPLPMHFVENKLKKYNISNIVADVKASIRDLIKPSAESVSVDDTKKILKSIDVVIDVSGFSITSKWDDFVARYWLSIWNLMQTYGAKIYLMPQSFGPFDFKSPEVIKYGKEVLSKCEHIYAREKSGYELLKGIGLTNIEYMPDSVLLEKDFDPSLVVKNIGKYREEIKIKAEHNICIIPNYRLIDQGGMDMNKLLKLYSDIVDKYMKSFDIYLVAHAGEDLTVCQAIKDKYKDDEKVKLIDHVMFSFNYEEFVKQMDFIVASRYHAIIHAYKEYVPAVILGWADKYQGVAEEVEQSQYIISLDDSKAALNKIDEMAEHYLIEKETIKKNVLKVQEKDCYAFLRDLHADR